MPPGEFGREASCVRLFMSADLGGSTAFKARPYPKEETRPPWLDEFETFYRFKPRCTGLEILKAIGDEVVLYSEIRTAADARRVIAAFRNKLDSANRKYRKKKLALAVKGTAWLAGFPINNHKVRIAGLRDPDFIGPSMDAGFRLTKLSTDSKMVVSVDLALLLLRGPSLAHHLVFDGTVSLKGVLGGRPYPIIWLPVGALATHEADARAQRRVKPLRTYCREFLTSMDEDSWLHVPYLSGDKAFAKKPGNHVAILARIKREEKKHQQGIVSQRWQQTSPRGAREIQAILDLLFDEGPAKPSRTRRKKKRARQTHSRKLARR